MSDIFDENSNPFNPQNDADSENENTEYGSESQETADYTADSFPYASEQENENTPDEEQPVRSDSAYSADPAGEYSGNTSSSYSGSTADSFFDRPSDSYSGNSADSYPGNSTGAYSGNTSGSYSGNPYSSYSGNQNGPYSYRQTTGNSPYSTTYRNPNTANYNPVTPPLPPEKKRSKGKTVLFALIIVIVILASLGIGIAIGGKSSSDPTSVNDPTQSEDTTATSVAVEVETTRNYNSQLSAVDIAEKVRPSVVGVMAYLNGQLEGEGSGVVFCEDSTKTYTYVMTCAHVISDKGLEFSVLTLDGKPYDAKLVGYDERSDIGVLRIETSGLSVATLGDSSSLKIGENVYAIGNPGGSEYFGSMTSGIVSAIDRSISSTYNMKVIQHDAAINPGNSGGALVNTSGQVIGINSSKIADTEFEGMGFAVPMSTAKTVAESLISYGYVPNRPMLGIKYADVSSYQFYSMLVGIKNLPQGSLIISSIATNSDLATKDVKSGDLIIAVNGIDMDTSDILLDLIEKSAVGDELTLTICRVDTKSYKTTTFDVKVKLVEDKGKTTYADEEETTTESYSSFPFGGNDYYDDFFRQFFGF